MTKKLALYTAIFGGYDQFVQPHQGDYDFYLFSDVEMGAGWGTFRKIKPEFEDPTRDARRVKVLSHRMLPEYEYTLWVDGCIRVRSIDPEALIEKWLGGKDLATFKHPDRDCLYQEAAILAHFRRDKGSVIQAQIERYRELGFPPGKGLAETAVVLRKNTPKAALFNDIWWNEIVHGSRRDQVSFPVAAWLSRLDYALMEGPYKDHGFERVPHLK